MLGGSLWVQREEQTVLEEGTERLLVMGGCPWVLAMEMAEVLILCIRYFNRTSPTAGCEAVRDTDLSSGLHVCTQWFDGLKIYQQMWKLGARVDSRDRIRSVDFGEFKCDISRNGGTM